MKNKNISIAVISLLLIGGGIAAYLILKKKKNKQEEVLDVSVSIEKTANEKFDKGENLTNEEAASLSNGRKKKLGSKVLKGAGIALGVGALALGVNEVVKRRSVRGGGISVTKAKTADTTISSVGDKIKTAYRALSI